MNGAPPSGVLILAGPTASGKTALALELAERYGAEIVGADSRQIYRDMPIGTAAPTSAEQGRVPHHLVAFLDPHERYSAALFARDAIVAIRAIAARGKRAIVAGGTGFYIRALCGDVALAGAFDPVLRGRLVREARLHPPAVLHEWLHARDPQRAAAVPPTDPYRIVRALEVALYSERSPAVVPSLRTAGIAFAKLVLDPGDVELERRITLRVDAMLAHGFVHEAERIGTEAVASDAVGYPHALAFARGWSSEPELRALLARATRRYAKRQRTWLRSEPDVTWIAAERAADAAARLAEELLGWR